MKTVSCGSRLYNSAIAVMGFMGIVSQIPATTEIPEMRAYVSINCSNIWISYTF
ncbi:MAG: hypothetical protein FWD71_16035 [Oscillospiraceae bacterium]|nr:hypothetical protein [Oscillospiraceae bacterium]